MGHIIGNISSTTIMQTFANPTKSWMNDIAGPSMLAPAAKKPIAKKPIAKKAPAKKAPAKKSPKDDKVKPKKDYKPKFKRAPGPYMIFCKAERPKIVKANSNMSFGEVVGQPKIVKANSNMSFGEVGKALGAAWGKL